LVSGQHLSFAVAKHVDELLRTEDSVALSQSVAGEKTAVYETKKNMLIA